MTEICMESGKSKYHVICNSPCVDKPQRRSWMRKTRTERGRGVFEVAFHLSISCQHRSYAYIIPPSLNENAFPITCINDMPIDGNRYHDLLASNFTAPDSGRITSRPINPRLRMESVQALLQGPPLRLQSSSYPPSASAS